MSLDMLTRNWAYVSLDLVRQFGTEAGEAVFMKRLQTALHPDKYVDAGMKDLV